MSDFSIEQASSLNDPSIPSELADAIEQLLQGGENFGPKQIDQLCDRYPRWANDLRQLLPTIIAIGDHAKNKTHDFSTTTLDPLHKLRGLLGDFEILQEIGRGGMGIVYEARQISLDRRVAVKVLPFAALLDHRRLTRFQNEARAAAMLKHPNIVSVFYVGAERGVHFYAMELIEGRTLADVIHVRNSQSSKEPERSSSHATLETIPIAEYSTDASMHRHRTYSSVARIGKQAAEALHYAHEEGVTHRDIKPSNLIIDNSGKLHVTDFGLAIVESSDHVTLTGDLVGTLRYMSPEQIDGAIVDRRTDVYSLGLTLYELSTGQRVFDGKNRNDLMKRIIDSQPVRPSQLNRRFPRDLETIILKSIAKDPSHRYTTAKQLADDLERFIENRPIQARKPTAIGTAGRWAARNPLVATLLLAIGMMLSVLLGVTAFAAWNLSQEAAEKERILYARDMRIAQTAIADADFISAERILQQWVQNGPTDRRGFEWFYLWRAAHPAAIKKTIAYEVPTFSINFMGTDQLLAVGHFMPKIGIWDIDSHEKPRLVHELKSKGMANVNCEFIDHENVLITSNRSGLVKEWDISRWKLLNTIDPGLPPSIRETPNLAASPSGDLLAITKCPTDRGEVSVWNRRNHSWLGHTFELKSEPHVAFLSDTKLVIGTVGEPTLRVVDIHNGQETDEVELQSDGIMNIAVTADRSLLATASYESKGEKLIGRIEFFDCDPFRPQSSLSLDDSYIHKIAFSSDGQYLAAGTEFGFIYLIDTTSRRVLAKRKMHMGTVFGLAFSRTDKYLASASGGNRVQVYDLETLLQPDPSDVTYRGLFKSARSLFVTNELAITAEQSGRVRFWDAHSGETLANHDYPNSLYNMAHGAVSPNGERACVTMGSWPPRGTPGIVKVFDTSSLEELATIEIPGGLSYCAPSVSCEGLMAVGGNKNVVIIDTKSARIVKTLTEIGWAKGVSFSSDGRALACAMANSDVHVYDLPNFQQRFPAIRTGADTCEHASFSPDGQLLAVADVDRDNCIKLYDAQNGVFLRRFKTLPNFQLMTEFSPDGKRLVSSGNSGKIRVWDVESGEQMISFEVAPGRWPSCDFSPDGKSIIASGGYFAKVFHSADPDTIGELTVSELNEVVCRTVATPDD